LVQLFISEDTIRSHLRRAKEELLPEYYAVLESLYYDLLSDPGISSLSTIKTRLNKAKLFLRYLQEHGIKPLDVDLDTVKRYILYLRLEKRVKQSTIKQDLKSVKRILKLLRKDNIAEKLKYPKDPIIPPKLPDPEIVEKIIADIKNLRTKVVVALMYETGARISEILALRRKHVIETPTGYYKIVIQDTKNNEFRTVYVIKYSGLIRSYLNITKGGPEDPVFPSPVDPSKPISPYNIEKTFKKISKKYGIELHPHMLRHLRATLLIKQGIPERITMKILGHRTAKMLRIYVNLVDKDVEEAILQYHGIRPEPNNSNEKEVVKCPRCGATNPREANYCWRCAYPLHQQAALELEIKEKDLEEKLRKLIEIIKRYPEIIKGL